MTSMKQCLNDTAFFEKPQYYGNVLWYEGEKYRYNLSKETD